MDVRRGARRLAVLLVVVVCIGGCGASSRPARPSAQPAARPLDAASFRRTVERICERATSEAFTGAARSRSARAAYLAMVRAEARGLRRLTAVIPPRQLQERYRGMLVALRRMKQFARRIVAVYDDARRRPPLQEARARQQLRATRLAGSLGSRACPYQ